MAKVVIFSGAGISAESGISTFRDGGGLWEEYDVDKVCRVGCLETNRAQTLEFYDKRRSELSSKEPNHAHKVIAELKNRYKDDTAVITQNVDNLFEKAGIAHEDVLHLHGYLTDVECEECGLVYDIGYEKIGSDEFDAKCPHCSSKKIRPSVVMFGEFAPNYEKLTRELRNCKLVVVIGTSGNVVGVNKMAQKVFRSILNNLEPSSAIYDTLFTKVIYKKCTEAIDEIKKDLETFITTGNVKLI